MPRVEATNFPSSTSKPTILTFPEPSAPNNRLGPSTNPWNEPPASTISRSRNTEPRALKYPSVFAEASACEIAKPNREPTPLTVNVVGSANTTVISPSTPRVKPPLGSGRAPNPTLPVTVTGSIPRPPPT